MRGRAVWLAAAATALLAVGARAGGPPPPTEPPEYFAHLQSLVPGSGVFTITGRVQYARPESLDLIRQAVRAARVTRVEAEVAAERVVLQPLGQDPERYRAQAPRGSSLAWSYEVAVGPNPTSPHAIGNDYACVWLAGLVLAPHLPTQPDSAAVTRVQFSVLNVGKGGIWGPWRRHEDLFHPASLDDLVDAYVAFGAWRVREHVVAAAACTLQVAIAGHLAQADSMWDARLAAELAPTLPHGGRALVCVVPTTGPATVRPARRSWLVRWPATSKEWPPVAMFAAPHSN